MNQLRVLIADEHPIIIEALRVFLGEYPDIQIVGAASNCTDTLAQLRYLHPDCMIVDLNQSIFNNAEILISCSKEHPDLEVVAYTEDTDKTMTNKEMRKRIRAYVSKREPVKNLANALRGIHHNNASLLSS